MRPSLAKIAAAAAVVVVTAVAVEAEVAPAAVVVVVTAAAVEVVATAAVEAAEGVIEPTPTISDTPSGFAAVGSRFSSRSTHFARSMTDRVVLDNPVLAPGFQESEPDFFF
jgi:hypothetical protein